MQFTCTYLVAVVATAAINEPKTRKVDYAICSYFALCI